MQRFLSLLLALSAAALPFSVAADGVRVHVAPQAGLVWPVAAAELVMRSGTADDGENIDETLPLGNAQTVLQAAAGARVTCRGESLWCPEVRLGDGDTDVTLPVFPALTVTGEVSVPRPGDLPARGWVQGTPGGEAQELEVRAALSVIDGRFSFSAPRVPLDLRFTFPGAAPVYRWAVQPPTGVPEPGTLHLDPLTLRPGGSVAGWVHDEESELPLAGALVTAALAEVEGTEHATSLRRHVTKTNEGGFFQVDGLEPGTYRLVVEAAERAPRALETAPVEGDAETRVGTVSLAHLVTASIATDPPRDPDGEPWRVVLRPLRPLPSEKPFEVQLDEGGRGLARDLRPAEYGVLVLSSRGDTLLTLRKQIGAEDQLLLTVPLTKVEGTVRLGGEPLAARVVVETGGGDHVALDSDEEGLLEGWIRPPERPWLLVTVSWHDGDEEQERRLELVPPAEHDGVLALEIELPAGVVYGQVVDADGRPLPGAKVTATPAAAATRFGSVDGESGSDSRFHLTGLEAVAYQVQAGGNGRAASEVVLVDLGSGLPAADVRLVVWPTRRVEARVTLDGQRVSGAAVQIYTVGRTPVSLEVRTGQDGSFFADLPRDAEYAVATVVAPSRLLWSACLRPGEETWTIALPVLPPGVLTLTTEGRQDLPPATGGRWVLLTGEAALELDLTGVQALRLRSADADGPP